MSAEIQDLLRDVLIYVKECERSPILASFEDCDYFRKHYQPPGKIAPPSAPLPIPAKQPPTTPPITTSPPPLPQKLDLPPPVAATPAPQTLAPQPPPTPKLDLPPPPLAENFEELRRIMGKIAPNIPLFDDIPNDDTAKKIGVRWKTRNLAAPITIIAYHEPQPQRALLEQIAKALDVVFGSARIVQADAIEKEKQWEAFLSVPHLKLAIVCDYSLWQLGSLMQHYREVPAQNTRQLGNVPVLLLPDLSLYLKDPLLKRSLWKALCQKIPSS